ncbi:MAG: hypothetical protein Q4A11_04780 [Brachymonas sp.]|nr:hypothetical protein [Brachymonas sp.]
MALLVRFEGGLRAFGSLAITRHANEGLFIRMKHGKSRLLAKPGRMTLTWRLSFQVDCRKTIIKKCSKIIPKYTGHTGGFRNFCFHQEQTPATGRL